MTGPQHRMIGPFGLSRRSSCTPSSRREISRLPGRDSAPKRLLARAYGLTGNKAEAQKVLDHFREGSKRRFISEYDFAVANSGWNPEEALAWLEKGYQNRAGLLVYLRVDSSFGRKAATRRRRLPTRSSHGSRKLWTGLRCRGSS